ncbi:MAG TPA: N-acyl homoserine lactonase family protein [Devosia sp.]|nr:N-acyl homoserine lactonase family protein [Devosia sp.]
MTTEPTYEVYAIRYGARNDRTRADSYLQEKNPTAPDSIEYFFWVIRNADRMYVVDTGFDAVTAKLFNRKPFDDPATLLSQFGIDAASVEQLIVTHMHFDHVGALSSFPKAKFHLQAADLAYATSPLMKYDFLRWPYIREHVVQMVGYAHSGRVVFHDGDSEIAPGLTVHRIDGHARGLQAVRVNTKRGHVLLASDAAAYAEQFLDYRVSPAVVDVTAMLEGYDRLRELADSEDHIITGHDPLTTELYPRVEGINATVLRLHEPPARTIRDAVKACWA